MKLIISIVSISLSFDVVASICVPPLSNAGNQARHLVSQAEVVFYGFPESTTSEITAREGEICFRSVTKYSSKELIKGVEKSVVATLGPICFGATSIKQESLKTKLLKTTNFKTSLLVFSKSNEIYRLNNCLLENYKSIGDTKFREQLGLKN